MSVTNRDQVTTTIFISNLHCGSCVDTIKEILQRLSPSTYSVHIYLRSQRVAVDHPTSLSGLIIKEAIEDAGFHIADATNVGLDRPLDLPFFSIPSHKFKKHLEQCNVCQHDFKSRPDILEAEAGTSSKHARQQRFLTLAVGGMTCASCTTTVTQALTELNGVHDVSVSLLGSSATATLDSNVIIEDLLETIRTIGYEAEVVSVQSPNLEATIVEKNGPKLRVTLTVAGMARDSCSSTVTKLLSELEGVEDVSVDLIGNSASFVVESRNMIKETQEVIKSAGFEASVITVEPVKTTSDTPNTALVRRTVALHVEGMFCDHCPEKVMQCLSKMSQVVYTEPLTLRNPILRLTYDPSPPTFTIRDVVTAIASAKSPPFRVTVHKTPSLEDRALSSQAREKRQLLYCLGVSVIIAIPTFVIGVFFMSLASPKNSVRMFLMEPMWTGNSSRIQWSLFFLATPVMFYSAVSFHRRGLKDIYVLWRKGSRTPVWKRFLQFGSMDLLVSSGVSVAYFSSIALLALAASSSPSPDGHGDTSTYFDSVVFLTMFLLIGRYIKAYAKGRTSDAITSLSKLKPAEAFVVVGLVDKTGQISSFPSENNDIETGDRDADAAAQMSKPGSKVQKVPADLLEAGDVIRVPKGATPAIDGVVVSGPSLFDESAVTGESKPIRKGSGDHVFLGTINIGQAVDVRIDVAEGKTMLDHVINVVRDSQTKKAPIERFADILTGYFVPVVTLLALLTWIVWLSLGLGNVLPRSYLDKDVGGWPLWSLEFAIAVFVVACPCGIGLAAPTALLVGSGVAAKFGILVRGGGDAFQEAAQLDAVIFDKTGTLTVGGQPTVTDTGDLCNRSPWSRDVVLGLAAAIEAFSSHPLATAVRSYCELNHAILHTASSVEEIPGRGLKATFQDVGCSVAIGSEAWMAEHRAEVPTEFADQLASWKSEGKSVVLLAVRQDNAAEASEASPFKILFLFAITDPLRLDAKAVVSYLQSQKLATWMISGDDVATAKSVAKQVGIPESNVIAGVLPHEKADKVRWLQENAPKKQRSKLFGIKLNNRCVVAMVGDGINDAPALAAADVAIAIGSGSDVALSSASFILVSSDLGSILTLVDLSATVFRRIKLNFLWALVYNIAAIPIAAGILYPIRHIRLDPVWASLAMALSSVSVTCSSLMLRRYKPPRQQ